MTLAFKLLAIAYQFLDQIIPRTTHICFISFPDVEDNALPVFLYFLNEKDNNAKLIWLVSDVNKSKSKVIAVTKYLNLKKNTYSFIKKNSLLGLYAFLRAKHVIFTHGHYRFVRPRINDNKLINLWHGMPLKAIGALDNKNISEIQATNLTIASSDFFKPIMAKAFNISENNVIVTGLPRCDALFSASIAAQQFKQAINKSNSLICWLPTYQSSVVGEVRSDSNKSVHILISEFENNLASLSALAIEYKCHIVVKLHPMDVLNNAEILKYPNVSLFNSKHVFPDDVNLYDLLAVADGLISDISSVSFDFMMTKKPILITKWFYKPYARNLCFNPQLLFDATYCCASWNAAPDFFQAVVNRDKAKSQKSDLFCQFYDNKSTDRFIQYFKTI